MLIYMKRTILRIRYAHFLFFQQPTEIVMPLIAEITETVKATRSLKDIIEQLGKFDTQELSVHHGCQKIIGIRLFKIQSIDHLKTVDRMIADGWSAPTMWELVQCKETVSRKIGNRWENAVLISKDPFHEMEVIYTEPHPLKKVAVLFPDKTGQFVLETIPDDAIRMTNRELLFVLVRYAK